jgi:hypothetical protein
MPDRAAHAGIEAAGILGAQKSVPRREESLCLETNIVVKATRAPSR